MQGKAGVQKILFFLYMKLKEVDPNNVQIVSNNLKDP